MTTHRTVPSEVEPEALADLIADCSRMPASLLPRRRVIDLRRVPSQRREIVIPDTTQSLVASYTDYGA